MSELIISNEQEIILGGGVINLKNKSLRNDNGDSVYLTDKENQLLKLLIEANPGGVAKGELLQNVWGYAENVKTSTLETHIYRLRKKISHVLGDIDLIVFRGGGYKINF